jgi:hypothetical protein
MKKQLVTRQVMSQVACMRKCAYPMVAQRLQALSDPALCVHVTQDEPEHEDDNDGKEN